MFVCGKPTDWKVGIIKQHIRTLTNILLLFYTTSKLPQVGRMISNRVYLLSYSRSIPAHYDKF